ncbi:MAG: GatB/YqeY domain-containing protein [Candidatus Omnitrophota bacterium]|nr:GatB/YqeY domain-containing protein [Candidatus Omnitrophota bacterium]
MLLEDKIMNDYKEAMKAKEAVKVSILSFLRSQFMNVRIDKKKDKLDDVEVVPIIKKLIKQHQDSIEGFKAGNRQDLVDKEAQELEILKAYLPQEISPEEIKKIIDEVIAALGATSMKDMGKVMKEVTTKTAGQADGKVVSDLVKERLMPKPA